MSAVVSRLAAWPTVLGVTLIRAYQRGVGPLFAPACRYWPSCSEYTRLAIQRRGLLRGGLAGVRRLLRCHPLCAGGIDPPR